jgi:hypothetical protein
MAPERAAAAAASAASVCLLPPPSPPGQPSSSLSTAALLRCAVLPCTAPGAVGRREGQPPFLARSTGPGDHGA